MSARPNTLPAPVDRRRKTHHRPRTRQPVPDHPLRADPPHHPVRRQLRAAAIPATHPPRADPEPHPHPGHLRHLPGQVRRRLRARSGRETPHSHPPSTRTTAAPRSAHGAETTTPGRTDPAKVNTTTLSDIHRARLLRRRSLIRPAPDTRPAAIPASSAISDGNRPAPQPRWANLVPCPAWQRPARSCDHRHSIRLPFAIHDDDAPSASLTPLLLGTATLLPRPGPARPAGRHRHPLPRDARRHPLHRRSASTPTYIADNTRRTLPEALQFTPGVLVQKTAHGHGSPFIRGFTGRQNLLLVDGVRINNSLFRGGPVQYWNTIDPLSLDRIELVRSQGSVLYGSDAVGGTLNAFTRSSGFADQPEGEFFSHGSAYYEYRSNGEGSHIGRDRVRASASAAAGACWPASRSRTSATSRTPPSAGCATPATRSRTSTSASTPRSARHHAHLAPPARQPGRHLALALDHLQPRLAALRPRHRPGQLQLPHLRPGTRAHLPAGRRREPRRGRRRQPLERHPLPPAGRRLRIPGPQARPTAATRPPTWKPGASTSSSNRSIGPGTLVYGLDYYHDEVDSAGYRDRGTGLAFDPSFRPVADDSSYDLFGAWAPVPVAGRPTARASTPAAATPTPRPTSAATGTAPPPAT